MSIADLMTPMSVDEARKALESLRLGRPELFSPAPPEGFARGIDMYPASQIAGVYRVAANIFHRAHKRFPDLHSLPATADGFFAMKFFYPVPLNPNPADKLAAKKYIPQPLRSRVLSPKRVWMSNKPALPPGDSLRPGHYWFKISNGNAMHARVMWPPSPAHRAEIEHLGRTWEKVRYGIRWGEWWYAQIPPRFFLEEDLSDRMAGQPEIKIFVRDGEVKLFYAIRHRPDGRNEQSFYDGSGNLLEGRSRQNVPLSCALPESLPTMLEAAPQIGRYLRLARIDWLNVLGPTPYLGEITLCHNNARRMLSPPELDAWARDQLFG